MNGNVTLDGIMIDNLFFSLFVDSILKSKMSVYPQIFDVVVMRVLFKKDLFEFIRRIHKNNWMVFCEFHQYWF